MLILAFGTDPNVVIAELQILRKGEGKARISAALNGLVSLNQSPRVDLSRRGAICVDRACFVSETPDDFHVR